MKRVVLATMLMLLFVPALSQPGAVYILGLAPNWDQPNDYPDLFDPSRPPFGVHAAWDAWCTPASGAMLIGHWEDVRSCCGLADGSRDGNQAIPNGYWVGALPGAEGFGPKWGAGPSWHDYTADGEPCRPGMHPNRGKRFPKDLGWYMDTNMLGDPARGNLPPPHVGTYYKDVAPGLNKFFKDAIGAGKLKATTLGVHPAFGAKSVPQLVNLIKNEIHANRTVIAHFLHWNIFGPPGPGQGNGIEDSEDDFFFSDPPGFGYYEWGPPTPGERGEVWNGDTGLRGLGHSGLIVGYIFDPRVNKVTHLIVHDNWPTTVRNVAIPVFDLQTNQWRIELVAITKVTGECAQ